MGLKARLTNIFASPAPRPPTRPTGESGRWHTNGYLQLEELNHELAHPHGHRAYDRMWRTDPDVRRAAWMFLNPALGGTWSVEPYGGEDADEQALADAELVRWALFEQLRGGLVGHLAQTLPVVARSGFAFSEQVWGPAKHDGETVLVPRRLLHRLPRSVTRWFQNDLEELTGVEQQTRRGGLVTLPASEIVYYRVGAEGDNWEGVSLLRPIYKPWFFKDNIERIDAIGQELEATGLPVVYPPDSAGTDPAVLDDLEDRLAQLRSGDTSYLIMPGPHAQDLKDNPSRGWRFEIQGRGGSDSGGRDAQKPLNYHSDKIAAGLVAEFMRLGQAGEGARATADVQQDPFLAAVEGFVSTVVEPVLNDGGDTIADGLAQRIVKVNRGERDGYPRVCMSLVDSTSLTELKEYVSGLVTGGALTVDEPLEDYLRERADLPPADPAERERRRTLRERTDEATAAALEAPPEPTDPTNAPKATKGKPEVEPEKPKTAARQQRDLRHWEQHISLDRIEAAIDAARARFQDAGAAPARQVARTVAGQVAQGTDPAIEPTGELVDAIAAVLADLYALGRHTVIEELDRQRRAPDVALPLVHDRPGAPGSEQWLAWQARRARLAATSVVAAVVKRVTGTHLQGETQPGALQAEGERAAAAALRSEAQLHATAALNTGRADQADAMRDEIAGARYTSILDGNRCSTCAGADDDVLRPLDDPVRLANKPPNRWCQGGDRCRCMEFFELAEEMPGDEPAPAVPSGTKVPQGDQAYIEAPKLNDYVLNPDHEIGGPKARLFRAALGFTRAHAGLLETQLLRAARDLPYGKVRRTEHGDRYEQTIPVQGVNGKTADVFVVWQIEPDGRPRLITTYPV